MLYLSACIHALERLCIYGGGVCACSEGRIMCKGASSVIVEKRKVETEISVDGTLHKGS